MPKKVLLRDIARRLDMSETTVSEALRGFPRVKAATREKVEVAARELGYRRNPLVGEVMSELRRSKIGAFRGTLAALDLDGANRRSAGGDRYHRELVAGAKARAEEFGFKVDAVGAKMSPDRLRQVLKARGVRGGLLLPMATPDFARLDLSDFAAIYADYTSASPAPHSICPDHYRAIFSTLHKLHALGYRKPGFVIQDMHDARLLHRWESGYNAFRAHYAKGLGMRCLPPHVVPYVPVTGFDVEAFKTWFAKSDCDVVISHQPRVKTLMEAAGARVPKTHGFCCLNLINCDHPAAGLDLRPRELGARAVELLIGQVLRNEHGLPSRPLNTTMPVDWVDGPTLRAVSE